MSALAVPLLAAACVDLSVPPGVRAGLDAAGGGADGSVDAGADGAAEAAGSALDAAADPVVADEGETANDRGTDPVPMATDATVDTSADRVPDRVSPNDVASARDAPEPNLVENPEFDNGTTGWVLRAADGAAASWRIVPGLSGPSALRVEISALGPVPNSIQLRQYGFALVQGRSYRLSFMAQSDTSKPMFATFNHGQPPYQGLAGFNVTVTPTPQTFSTVFVAGIDSPLAQLLVSIGGDRTGITFDRFVVTPL